jgi:bifunctional DNA-binding transcriptional regulator/antitoxin component of YhaV-PrlF toxin-antitoxin module
MAKKKGGWPEIGVITKNAVKDKDGNVVKVNGVVQTKLGFKFADNVEIFVDGQKIELNKYRSGVLKSPIEEVESLYKNGAISDGDIEERRSKAKEVNEWLRYKIQVPPARQDD